jgi:hypothetical protein
MRALNVTCNRVAAPPVAGVARRRPACGHTLRMDLRDNADFSLDDALHEINNLNCGTCKGTLIFKVLPHPRLELAAGVPVQREKLDRLALAMMRSVRILGMAPGVQEDACAILFAINERFGLQLPVGRDTMCRNQCRVCHRRSESENLVSCQITVNADTGGDLSPDLVSAVQNSSSSHRANFVCSNQACAAHGFQGETVITELTVGAGPEVLLIELKRSSKSENAAAEAESQMYWGRAAEKVRKRKLSLGLLLPPRPRRQATQALVEAPYTLSAADLRFPDGHEDVYEVVAVILHLGESMNRGHYTVKLLNRATGRWTLYDDEKVEDAGSGRESFSTRHDYTYVYLKRPRQPSAAAAISAVLGTRRGTGGGPQQEQLPRGAAAAGSAAAVPSRRVPRRPPKSLLLGRDRHRP